MAWEYTREEQTFEPLPEGKYRIRIKSAEKVQSSTGRDMIALQFDVSGKTRTLYHYIVFLQDRPEITNRNLTQFFDSFVGIKEGDFDTAHWVGQVGACYVKHEEYNDQIKERIKYFISADKAADLPAWAGNDQVTFTEVSDDDLPF